MTRLHAGLVAVAMFLFLACGGSVIDGGERSKPGAQGGGAGDSSTYSGGTGGDGGAGQTTEIDGGSVDAALAGCTLGGPQFEPANLGEAEQFLVGVWLSCAGELNGCEGLAFNADHTWRCVTYDEQGHLVLHAKDHSHAGDWQIDSSYHMESTFGGGGGPNEPIILRKSPRRLSYNYSLYVGYP